MWLTYVDSPTVALHEQQRKHVQRNQVDDENVTSPRRHLQQARVEEARQQDLRFLEQNDAKKTLFFSNCKLNSKLIYKWDNLEEFFSPVIHTAATSSKYA